MSNQRKREREIEKETLYDEGYAAFDKGVRRNPHGIVDGQHWQSGYDQAEDEHARREAAQAAEFEQQEADDHVRALIRQELVKYKLLVVK